MFRLFILLLISSSFCIGCDRSQKATSPPTFSSIPPTTNSAYIGAIATYIQSAQYYKSIQFDTLFIGDRQMGSPDDFPKLSLPDRIGKTVLKIVSPAEGLLIQQNNPKALYINLIGWVDSASAQFIFVGFAQGFKHQFDFVLNYQKKSSTDRLELTDITYQPFLVASKSSSAKEILYKKPLNDHH